MNTSNSFAGITTRRKPKAKAKPKAGKPQFPELAGRVKPAKPGKGKRR